MIDARIGNKSIINEANWTASKWISRAKSYLLKYGKTNGIDWINVKIQLNWIDIYKIEKII